MSSSVCIVAGRERGSARSISLSAPLFQRSVRWAAALSRSTFMMTSSRNARGSSFLSRGVVVAACQMVGKIGPEREQTVALLLGEHARTLPSGSQEISA